MQLAIRCYHMIHSRCMGRSVLHHMIQMLHNPTYSPGISGRGTGWSAYRMLLLKRQVCNSFSLHCMQKKRVFHCTNFIPHFTTFFALFVNINYCVTGLYNTNTSSCTIWPCMPRHQLWSLHMGKFGPSLLNPLQFQLSTFDLLQQTDF